MTLGTFGMGGTQLGTFGYGLPLSPLYHPAIRIILFPSSIHVSFTPDGIVISKEPDNIIIYKFSEGDG